jgi:hypothetical protein
MRRRSELSVVVSAILRTSSAYAEDILTAYYGFETDSFPEFDEVAQQHGWTVTALQRELNRSRLLRSESQ